MDEQETHADIIAEMRMFKCCNLETGKLELCSAIGNYFADRLDAAHRRELSKNASKNGADFGQLGDVAKLREVVGDLLYMAERYVKKTPATESVIFDAKTKKETRTVNYYDVIAKAQAALAEPPRNCDVYTADPDWKATCAKCKEGDIEPKHCEYYGEPNGCNSPIYGEHPTAEKSSAVGDAAKLREALEATLDLFRDIHNTNRSPQSNQAYAVIKQIKAALAAPPRNCDVGTAKEQAERYGRYCDKFTSDSMHCETCPCCGKIPFGKCEFAWAQMPYEEGGTK